MFVGSYVLAPTPQALKQVEPYSTEVNRFGTITEHHVLAHIPATTSGLSLSYQTTPLLLQHSRFVSQLIGIDLGYVLNFENRVVSLSRHIIAFSLQFLSVVLIFSNLARSASCPLLTNEFQRLTFPPVLLKVV